jgi:hypothetical protein
MCIIYISKCKPYNYNGTNEDDERKINKFRSFISHEFYVIPMKIQTWKLTLNLYYVGKDLKSLIIFVIAL